MAAGAPCHGVSPVGLLLVLVAALLAPLASAQPWPFCGISSSNYTDKSPYQANIQLLSTTLPKNASRNLFAKDSVGTVPNIVHALTLCRGDINASACESCVTLAFMDAQQLCAYDKEATIFYDNCYLRFSNVNFLSSTDNGNPAPIWNSQNVSSSFKAFDAAVVTLLNATGNYAAANSTKRFATGEEAFDSSNPTIYGLTQCVPDMSPADCRTCIGDMLGMIPQYFSGSQGARVFGIRCNFRYEVYSFFGSPSLRLPAPALPPAPAPAPAPVVNATPLVTPGPQGSTGHKTSKFLAIVLPIVALVLATVVICSCILRRKRKTREKPYLPDTINPEGIQSFDSLIIDISTLRAATGKFDEANKLGEGAFGVVYKGILPDDQEVAVKRLSQSSRQGIDELKNELVLVAKLQHKNLVRLVGVCLEDDEKLLVYEYMPNNSLDTILFDPEKRSVLDWGKRFKIVNGIARGLQYLHEDSQVKIIHRDLKASNILLDADYNPKISDFGLARLFGNDQTQDVTNRVVGTYGYMAPEYAMRGHYSIKSDVFSFGVLILEIVTGRKNGGSNSSEDSIDLLNFVWEHWTTGTLMEIMDSALGSIAPRDQMVKCIQIGLLCVQDDPMDRPMMSIVNVVLSSNTVTLSNPSKPAFCFRKNGKKSTMYMDLHRSSQSTGRSPMSQNEVSITELELR